MTSGLRTRFTHMSPTPASFTPTEESEDDEDSGDDEEDSEEEDDEEGEEESEGEDESVSEAWWENITVAPPMPAYKMDLSSLRIGVQSCLQLCEDSIFDRVSASIHSVLTTEASGVAPFELLRAARRGRNSRAVAWNIASYAVKAAVRISRSR